MLLFTVPVTSNASRHFKSPLAMGEMPFKIKRASSVPISVVIDTGVNSNSRIQQNLHKNFGIIKKYYQFFCAYAILVYIALQVLPSREVK